ncbi:zinc-binding dehydrogenase, partial [Verrucomicrobiota bacterium]
IDIAEAEQPVPGPGEVIVETILSAICGSELHGYRGDGMREGNSGHEGMGRVAAVGEGVEELSVGDRVGASAVFGCGKPDCEYCNRGESTWCPSFSTLGSMHAQFFRTSARACMRIPDDIPDRAAVLLAGDGFGVPYHTAGKMSETDVRTVAIIGMGPIGLGNAMLQAFLGRTVIAVDISPYRLEYARKLGATHLVNAADADTVEAVRALTDGGADVCVEAAGRPETLRQCFAAARTAGRVVINGEQPAVEISPSNDFVRRDITAVGSWFFQLCEFDGMVDLYRKGLDVTQMVSHVFSYRQASEAFRLFAAGEAAKVLLDWRDT